MTRVLRVLRLFTFSICWDAVAINPDVVILEDTVAVKTLVPVTIHGTFQKSEGGVCSQSCHPQRE